LLDDAYINSTISIDPHKRKIYIFFIHRYIDHFLRLFSVAPQIAPFSISEEPANWGEQVSAMCSILKGDLPIEIRWSLNGEIITRLNHPDVIITNTGKKTSVLTIESVTARHAGEYSCVASNLVGSVSRSAVLSVNGIFKKSRMSRRSVTASTLSRKVFRNLSSPITNFNLSILGCRFTS